MFRSPTFVQKLKLLVIDEAHTMIDWGEGRGDDVPFREWFGKIGELRSLLPGCPMLAITATSSRLTRKKICQKLGMLKPLEIVESPDRCNIKLCVKSVISTEPVEVTFNWLIELLWSNVEQCPRFLVFCRSIADCAKLYYAFRSELPVDIHKRFNMYHSETIEHIKKDIRGDMTKQCGVIKVLFCTSAAGMGVNFKNISHVIHYGPPRDIDAFVQQIGRAGRDNSQSFHALLYTKRQLVKVESDIIMYVQAKGCRRAALMAAYGGSCSTVLGHLCCDNCHKQCSCGQNCEDFLIHPALKESDHDLTTDDHLDVRSVTPQQRTELKKELIKFCASLDDGHCVTVDKVIIQQVMDNCSKIANVETLMDICDLWYFEHGLEIMNMIEKVTGE